MPEISEIKTKKRKAELPPVYHRVLVQCIGYRGLAYRDLAGQWKSASDNRKLPKDVEILMFN